MGSKKLKNKKCVYCNLRPATSSDHVFAREFFLISARDNLPQVPACDDCNHSKSTLEHYLATTLPFGGRHEDAENNLANNVPKRLSKNDSLRREIREKSRPVWELHNGLYQQTITIPIQHKKITSYFAFVARALAWHHWRISIVDHISRAHILSRFGQRQFDRVFAIKNAKRVEQNLGNQTVIYNGIQPDQVPDVSFWRFQIYGGIAFAGDPSSPNFVAREIGAVTGPRNTPNKSR